MFLHQTVELKLLLLKTLMDNIYLQRVQSNGTLVR